MIIVFDQHLFGKLLWLEPDHRNRSQCTTSQDYNLKDARRVTDCLDRPLYAGTCVGKLRPVIAVQDTFSQPTTLAIRVLHVISPPELYIARLVTSTTHEVSSRTRVLAQSSSQPPPISSRDVQIICLEESSSNSRVCSGR